MPDAAEGEVLGDGHLRRAGVSEARLVAADARLREGLLPGQGLLVRQRRSAWRQHVPELESAKRSGAKVIGYLLEWPL